MNIEAKKITFLVVDDNDFIRRVLKEFFKKYNIEVVACLDGLEGIKMAVEYKPALIFLDLMMPNLDGIKMLKVIKMMDGVKSIPVIVISGNTNRTNVIAAHEAGADRILSKPLNKEIIIKTVTELVGKDFLKNENTSTSSSDEEFILELKKLFIAGFPDMKKTILEAFGKKDKKMLKAVIHNMRGMGTSIGYPQMTNISGEIEQSIDTDNINWETFKIKTDHLFELAEQIESSLQVIEG